MIIIQVKETFEPIYKAAPKNIRCPNCDVKDNVEITVYQKHIDTGLIYKVTKKLSGTAYCSSCYTDLPNVKWTTEIENAFEHLKTEAPIEKPYAKWSLAFKLLLGFLAIAFIAISIAIYSLYAKNNSIQQIIDNPSANNKLLISHTVREDYTKTQDNGNKWAVIRRVEGDTIVIQFHKDKVLLEEINDSKAPATGYDGPIYKIKKSEFQKKKRVTEYHEKNNMGLNYAYIWSYQKK